MLKLIYDIAIYGYAIIIRLISPLHTRARLFLEGRQQSLRKKIELKEPGQKRIWIHASSLGEFEQGRPVIEKLRTTFPHLSIVLTFFSPSGYEVRKNYEKVDFVTYLPIDTPANAREFIKQIMPDLAIFVKYDIWLNYLKNCFKLDIPVIFVSARFRPDQYYFTIGKSLYFRYFKNVKQFLVQDSDSKSVLTENGLDNVIVTGDTRVDRVTEIAKNSRKFPAIEKYIDNYNAIVCGSTWSSDIDILSSLIKEMKDSLKFVIAPHDVSERSIDNLAEQLPGAIRYSNMADNNFDKRPVLIIDEIGMLSSLYAYGKYAYVGGGFRGALHNILEPAAHGIPVFFGHHANNVKFPETSEIVSCGGGIAIKDSGQILAEIKNMEDDKSLYEMKADAASRYIHSKVGATDRVLEYLSPFLA